MKTGSDEEENEKKPAEKEKEENSARSCPNYSIIVFTYSGNSY